MPENRNTGHRLHQISNLEDLRWKCEGMAGPLPWLWCLGWMVLGHRGCEHSRGSDTGDTGEKATMGPSLFL